MIAWILGTGCCVALALLMEARAYDRGLRLGIRLGIESARSDAIGIAAEATAHARWGGGGEAEQDLLIALGASRVREHLTSRLEAL